MFLEINAAPLFKCFDNLGFYPEKKILDIAKNYKLKYISGSDLTAQTIRFFQSRLKARAFLLRKEYKRGMTLFITLRGKSPLN